MPGELIPIFGMITGTIMTGFLAVALVMILKGPVGQALARRMQGRAGEMEQELIGEVQALRDQVSLLEQQAVEMEERLEFAERLLLRGDQPTAAERQVRPPLGG